MGTNPVGRMDQNTDQSLIDEFLSKGGTITKCAEGSRTENIDFNSGFYNRKRKPAVDNEPADESNDE